jgi:hypothetical protein
VKLIELHKLASVDWARVVRQFYLKGSRSGLALIVAKLATACLFIGGLRWTVREELTATVREAAPLPYGRRGRAVGIGLLRPSPQGLI